MRYKGMRLIVLALGFSLGMLAMTVLHSLVDRSDILLEQNRLLRVQNEIIRTDCLALNRLLLDLENQEQQLLVLENLERGKHEK